MIKANELRIGNMVADAHGNPETVEDINSVGINLIDESLGVLYWYSEIYGIPLTPEWLRELGFEWGPTMERGKDDSSMVYSLQIANDQYLEYQECRGVDPADKKCSWYEWRIVNNFSWLRVDFWGQPKYVHQLQNLFFALTGEELILYK